MSIPAKVTFAVSCVVSTGIIGYVHVKQVIDREKLHEGVLRDIERHRKPKVESSYISDEEKGVSKTHLYQKEV